MAGGWLMAALSALPCATHAQELNPYVVVGDGIPQSLTGAPGDASRGRALVLERSGPSGSTFCISLPHAPGTDPSQEAHG